MGGETFGGLTDRRRGKIQDYLMDLLYAPQDEELHPPASPLEEELQQAEPPSHLQAMEDELAAKNLAVEELSRELEEIRAAFGAEGVQQVPPPGPP